VRRPAGILILIAAAITMRCIVLPRVLPAGEVDYRGEKIRLSRWYFDYDDYKNDPDNIAQEEKLRVEQLVTTAPISQTFASRMEMLTATSGLRFPGYGSAHFGEIAQPDGSVLAGYSVEVPLANKDRVFVFRGKGGQYALVDDFVASADHPIMAVRQEGGEFVYSTLQRQDVLRRPGPTSR
jgi:hypothetical protein